MAGRSVPVTAAHCCCARQTKRLNLLPRLAECFLDGRNPQLVEHSVQEMVSQRVYGLALGYEDLNDHEQLRQGSVLGSAGRQGGIEEEPLAGKSTLEPDGTGRRERRTATRRSRFGKTAHRRAAGEACSWNRSRRRRSEIVLDVDTTDVPLHGKQEGRFFHGYYDSYCYLPLYVFCGDHVLCARIAGSPISDASVGCLAEIRAHCGRRFAPPGRK